MDQVRTTGLSLEVKNEEAGEVTAIIATTNTGPDSDGDIYGSDVLGGRSQSTMILPAHDSHSVPLGKATVRQTEDALVADMKFNLGIEDGRKWFDSIRFDLENGESKQNYSYGFRILKAGQDVYDGESVNRLDGLDIFEVSPVIRGAGNNTRTVTVKGNQPAPVDEHAKAVATMLGNHHARQHERLARRLA